MIRESKSQKLSRAIYTGLVGVLIALLVACKPHPPRNPTAGTDIYNTLQGGVYTDQALNARDAKARHTSIGNALLPPLSVNVSGDSSLSKPHRFNVAAKNVPAGSFFLSLVSGTNYNMLIDPNISGKISLKLKNVTIEETLEAIRELYGYEYQRTSTGYEILPPNMKTQIFTVNYLDIKRSGKSRTELVPTQIVNGTTNGSGSSSGQPTAVGATQTTIPGSSVTTNSDYDFWKELAINMKTLIGSKDGRWVIVNPQASTVMVHAYPKELHEAADYLDHVQNNLQRQVIIEAKVLEVELEDEYKAGINWKALGLSQTGNSSPYAPFSGEGFVTLSGTGGNNNEFTTLIKLLESQGNVQVLSSPHVSTVNNQEAVIKVGEDQFFVTGYTSNVTPTGDTNTTSQSVALTPFFSGITLDVTPQISSNGDLVLYIHPAVSTVTDQTKEISLGDGAELTLPLARSTIRESDSVVHAKSGQIIVLGGLMQHKTTETIDATPGLSKVPFAGAAARDTSQYSKKSELVILLKPIVVDNFTWPKQLQHSANRIRRLNKGFHFGGMPQVFGDEAEANP